ncbi:MAG: hypothetical protein MI976_08065 [Pseudomonadales bacterium]|nr:hypothetical protein [Pseudomonadales bacterium]
MINNLIDKILRRERFEDNSAPIPWIQQLNTPESRLLYCDYSEYEAIKYLRDHELLNPAPFSNRSLIELHNYSTLGYECPIDITRYRTHTSTTYKMDVPILNIIGAGTTANMHNFIPGKTYRDVLFTCLHGAGLNMKSLEFLSSTNSKDGEMPHSRVNNDRKTRSKRPLELTRFGDYFFSSNGHQRTVFAMYFIWQMDGINGLLKNVTVNELFALPEQRPQPSFWID